MTDTLVGYVVTCQQCGADALQVQMVTDLQGRGDGGLVQCVYVDHCEHCDGDHH